ncbi:MAG: hypothetical protein AB2992_02870 [Candidatus Symbiodolus clandestinus]
MPKTQASNSTGSSGLGITRKLKKNHLITPYDLPRNQDLINLITNDKKSDIHDIEFLCKIYIFKDMFPPIDFKELCNSAITYDQPFYLSLILNDFGRGWSLRKNKSDSKATPLITATYSKKIYPFAMLLCLKNLNELHINSIIEDENIFDRINTSKESFYVFLLAMKNKDLINRINDEKHKNISHLKIKINHIVNRSLLHNPYNSINLEFHSFNQALDNLRFTKNGIYMTKYSEVMKLKSFIETATNKIEEKLKNLREIFMQICNLPDQVIKNHTTNNIYPNPPLSHAPQSNSQTGHSTCQNLTNTLASHHLQSSHQASHSTTDQQCSSLSSDHSPAFRSEQFVSQKPQNINSISDLVNISLSFQVSFS